MRISKTLRRKAPQLYLSVSGLSKDDRAWPGGRGWLYLGEMGTNKCQTLALEWHMLKDARHTGATVTLNAVDGDQGICFFVGVHWLFCLWFTIERVPKWMLPGHWADSRLRPGEKFWYPEEREIGVRIFDQAIWVSLWNNTMEWNKSDPWWWEFTIRPLDILLGRQRYSSETLMTGRCLVPMPEHPYWADYKVFESTWKRPRWPWPTRVTRVEIENDDPIPLPGKGTMPYNCDDDASYSITMVLEGSVDDAARKYANDIVRDRVKLCGREIYP